MAENEIAGKRIDIDGKRLQNGTWRNCTFVYSGGALPSIMPSAKLIDPKFEFAGSASRTLQLYALFAQASPHVGKQLLENAEAALAKIGMVVGHQH